MLKQNLKISDFVALLKESIANITLYMTLMVKYKQ